jgi:hypothetical protein
VWRTLLLPAVVRLGARIGARLSTMIHGNRIIRGLVLALGAVGLRPLLIVFHIKLQ